MDIAFVGVLALLALLASLIGSPIAAFRAHKKADANAQRLNALDRRLAELHGETVALRAALADGQTVNTPPAPSRPAPPQTDPWGSVIGTAAVAAPQAQPEPLPAAAPTPPAAPSPALTSWSRLGTVFAAFEETFAARWLVWLGALALALSTAFLVKYSIDSGLLSPAVRVSMGLAAGLALVACGEWLRRRPLHRRIAAIRPDNIPAALSAAGLFGCFASLYAAYALYALLPPLIAFAGLAGIALAAIGLALLHGPLVAAIGIAGAFATPALVGTVEPSAWRLFAYLLFVQAAALGVVRYKNWWWLGAATLAGVFLWPSLWMQEYWQAADSTPLAIYLLATAALFFIARRHAGASAGPFDWRMALRGLALPDSVSLAAVGVLALLFIAFVGASDHSTLALVALGLFGLMCMAAGRDAPVLDVAPVAAALATLAMFALWLLPAGITSAAPMFRLDGEAIGRAPGAPMLPPELLPFIAAACGFALLYAVGGFVALWSALRPPVWAALSAAAPLSLLLIAYWRVTDFAVDPGWTFVALTLAALAAVAAVRVATRRNEPGMQVALAFYAAGVAGAIALGVTMSLRQAWLTVALSLMLPVLGWIATRIRVRALRLVAAALAAAVLVRLTLNQNLLDYAMGETPLTSWVLYGYGVPAIAFFAAARAFGAQARDRLDTLLYAGALIFSVLLVTLQIRLFATGTLDSSAYGLLEAGLQTMNWLGIGTALVFLHRHRPHPVAYWGARLLIGLAASQIVLGHMLTLNPLITNDPIAGGALFNALLLAYAVPAAFALVLMRLFAGAMQRSLTRITGLSGLLLIFVWLTLEVARHFQGPVLAWPFRSTGELYAYSAAWLAFTGVLVGLSLWRRSQVLRHAALAVLVIVVIKVFGYDMAGLTGLYRVASFFGLGLLLVGIGYLYQRFAVAAPYDGNKISRDSAPSDAP